MCICSIALLVTMTSSGFLFLWFCQSCEARRDCRLDEHEDEDAAAAAAATVRRQPGLMMAVHGSQALVAFFFFWGGGRPEGYMGGPAPEPQRAPNERFLNPKPHSRSSQRPIQFITLPPGHGVPPVPVPGFRTLAVYGFYE